MTRLTDAEIEQGLRLLKDKTRTGRNGFVGDDDFVKFAEHAVKHYASALRELQELRAELKLLAERAERLPPKHGGTQ